MDYERVVIAYFIYHAYLDLGRYVLYIEYYPFIIYDFIYMCFILPHIVFKILEFGVS